MLTYYFEQFKNLVVIFAGFKQVKNLLVIFAGFKQVKNLLVIFLTLNKSKASFGETPWLTEGHATPLVTSFFVVTMLLGKPWRMPCHACGHLVIYRESYGFERAFLTFRRFKPYTPSCWFQSFPGAGSSTSELARLHADLQNIAPARLFPWITAIPKRAIMIGSIYVSMGSFKVRVLQLWNLPLTGFEPAFLKVLGVNSRLSWRSGHRVLCELIYG